MQYILREDFEDHIKLFIEIENCGKFGLKVIKEYSENYPELLELHITKAKKAIARSVFEKHKIIIDDYVPLCFKDKNETNSN